MKIYSLLLYTLIISCCFDISNNNNSMKRGKTMDDMKINVIYYDSNDVMTSKVENLVIGLDTIPHGNAIFFYPNGEIKLELSYEYGKKQGSIKGYFENGMLEQTGWYTDDLQDSVWQWYYNMAETKNQQIRAIYFWRKGQSLSHQMKYYPDGNIKEYFFYDPMGRLIYKREYDKNGMYIREEGSKNPQVVVVSSETNYQFNKGDILRARIYHISPPETEANVYVRIEGLQDEWELVSPKKYYTPLEYKLDKHGDYILYVKLIFHDNITAKSEEFIVDIEFLVH